MAGLQPQPPGAAEVTSVIMGYVHCRYNVAVGRALPSASKSGAQGLEPKTPGEVSNAWGRQVQCQSPLLSPCYTGQRQRIPHNTEGLLPASATAKTEDCLPSQFRYLTERAQDSPRAAWKTSKAE